MKQISVWLGEDPASERRNLHCLYCGKTFIEITGKVKYVLRGDAHVEQKGTATVVRCKNFFRNELGGKAKCKAEYIIMA